MILNFKNMFLVVLTFSLLFLISGCGGGNSKQYDIPTNDQFRVGTAGLDVNFLRNSPPYEIVEGSSLNVVLELENKGAYDIEQGIIKLNYDSDYLEVFSNSQKTFSLEGKNKFNKKGQSTVISFDAKARMLEAESNAHDVPITASSCYLYKTVLNDEVCVGKTYDDSIDNKNKVCTVSDKSYSGQGAPIRISSIKIDVMSSESMGTIKPVFDIEIDHVGRGLVLDSESYRSACTSSRSSLSDNINSVKINEISLSEYPLVCNKNVVTLRDGSARLRCELAQGVYDFALPYIAPLYIELEYGYSEFISHNMEIIRG